MIGFVSPLVREVLERRYLWQVPHRIDGSKLAAALPAFHATSAQDAIAASLVPHAPHDGTLRDTHLT